MNTKQRTIAALMRVYPVPWRREYGAELEEVLGARPLSVGIAVNVVANGFRQRLRLTEPATILGLMMMAVVIHAFLFSSQPVLQPSGITWPSLVVSLLNPSTEIYALLLMACGAWTHLKYCDRMWRSATAAMTMTFIGGIPVMVAGALMLADIASVSLNVAFATLVAPICALPYAGLWGAVGGQIGNGVSYLRRRLASS